MRIAYFDCSSGISGDMIIGALLDLGLDFKDLKKELKKLNLNGYELRAKKVDKKGVKATKFDVIVKHHKHNNHERHLNEINELIDKSRLNKEVKALSKKIFLNLGKAEAKVHGIPLDHIHFHEIGAIDSIIDIVGVSIGIKKLGIQEVYCSALNAGKGYVEFSHGKMRIPAPATLQLIKNRGIPYYSSDAEGELATPTGAAIVAALAKDFYEPFIQPEKEGYGAGAKDLKIPNVLKIAVGEKLYEEDKMDKIETNIDDMNPQFFDYVIERLLKAGAKDAWVEPVYMKKRRIAGKLIAICDKKLTTKLADIIFNETTTLGIRINEVRRIKLEREIRKIKTKYGYIRVKIGKAGDQIKNIMPEYDDCKKIARRHKIPLKLVYDEIKRLLK